MHGIRRSDIYLSKQFLDLVELSLQCSVLCVEKKKKWFEDVPKRLLCKCYNRDLPIIYIYDYGPLYANLFK